MTPETKVAIDHAVWQANDYTRIKQEHAGLLGALKAIANGEKWNNIPAMAYKSIARSALAKINGR